MPMTSEPTVRLALNQEGRKAVDKPVNGRGGAQDILNHLKERFRDQDSAELPRSLIGRVASTAANGKGGFQGRAKKILSSIAE